MGADAPPTLETQSKQAAVRGRVRKADWVYVLPEVKPVGKRLWNSVRVHRDLVLEIVLFCQSRAKRQCPRNLALINAIEDMAIVHQHARTYAPLLTERHDRQVKTQ